jgi:glycosyltransferase involved in cell wall biosynthesis
MSTLSIVVPAYNEEDAIGGVLDRIDAQRGAIPETIGEIRNVEVIVVDDGSSDRTADIVRARSSVRLVSHPRNLGYGAALKTGIRAASGDFIGFLDADGTYPPEAFPQLVAELFRLDADIVTGSRMSGGKSGMPFVRWLGNKFFARLVSLLAPGRVLDSASGMRVARREALARLGLLPDGLDFIVALATQAMHEKLLVAEVPIAYDERVGQSKLRVLNDGLAFAGTILRIATLYDPLKLFTFGAALAFLAGLALAARPLYGWLTTAHVPEWAIYRLVTVLVLFVAGFSVAVFGLLVTQVLAILRGEELRPRGRVERALLSPRLPARLALCGFVLMIFAPAVSYRAMAQYLTTFHINIHWSPVLLGATSFLLGVQALLASVLLYLLEQARRAKAGWLGRPTQASP